ncbi:pentapeptide repeat-containing protein [Nonomuraea sediminis]|uniref:pentapeptide repeat-containing protein n=1 Tax=Nonomuraea sediminis TaxID=2835864 RepID=UPI001BDDB7C4|nr:pentapeptide repeat-containing protein [Nonomuraea sediminis]
MGVLFGLLFTAGGLYYTAKTWESGQETLKATQQQSITDRYTKAVEQIGSDKSVEVRIGGIYALERIAADSSADAETIENVVVAFILEHDGRTSSISISHRSLLLPERPKKRPLWRPGADVLAALRVLGTIAKSRHSQPDLSSATFAYADWSGANLTGAYLSQVDLGGAKLADAVLAGSNLSRAWLDAANLASANLSKTNLTQASMVEAELSGANLQGANLSEANLLKANMLHANVIDTNIAEAFLPNGDISNGDLSGISNEVEPTEQGMPPQTGITH